MEISEKKKILSREELQMKKRRRAKARAAVITVFILLLVIVIVTVLLKTVLFPISNITVEGNKTVSAQDIISSSGIEIGDRLFSVSAHKLNKSLTVKQPYIKSVKIKYPSFKEIKLLVTETNETFCYQNGSKFFITDIENKVLRESSQIPDDITVVRPKNEISAQIGYKLSVDDFETVSNIYEFLEGENISVNELDISNISFISLKIKGRFIVNLGSVSELQGKLEHLKAMLPEIDSKNGADITGEIDLSSWSTSKREGFFKPKTIN